MFIVHLKKSVDKSIQAIHTVCVDTLYEAEIMAQKTASKYFGGGQVVLVHRGELEYDVYKVTKPVGCIRITLTKNDYEA